MSDERAESIGAFILAILDGVADDLFRRYLHLEEVPDKHALAAHDYQQARGARTHASPYVANLAYYIARRRHLA